MEELQMNIHTKSSYYNFIIDTDDDGQIIYNTKTGAIDIIEPDYRSAVQEILSSPSSIPETSTQLFNHMLTQGYIVEKDKDELNDIITWHQEANRESNIAYLTILPTETCNFTCPYCFIYTFREKHMKPEVYESIYKYIENFFEKNKNEDYCVFTLSWFGGEPLLVSDQILSFMSRIKALKERYPNAILNSEITTNGYCLTPDLFFKLLASGIKRYQVTLDGDAESHDQLRTLPHKQPTFDIIYQNILGIKQHSTSNNDFQFVIRSNFLRSTVKNSEHLLQLYKKDFADDSRFRIYFRPVYNFETDRDSIHEVESDLCENIEGVSIQNRLSFETLAHTENVLESIANPLPTPTKSWCLSVKDNSNIIGYDGSVFSCDTMIVEKEKSIGYLNSDGKIIFNEKADTWKKSIFETKNEQSLECLKCKLLPVCMGGCNRARHITGKNPCFWTEELIYKAMSDYSKMI